MSLELKHSTDKPELPPPAQAGKFAKYLAPLALAGTVVALAHPFSSGPAVSNPESQQGQGGPHYTQAELAKLPAKTESVPAGGGALNVVEAADPQIAPQDSVTTAELEQFVNNQAPYHDQILQAGEHVQVPVIPPQAPEHK